MAAGDGESSALSIVRLHGAGRSLVGLLGRLLVSGACVFVLVCVVLCVLLVVCGGWLVHGVAGWMAADDGESPTLSIVRL